ncbi:MAG: hypothetical protein HND44_02430 [Chloroflexi bacterium]|nr:hypothetical protein [Ardenticatenaceae bacterium]NOG33417.1 hypothetical protein [Chloroflexota bacterium]
MNTMKKSGLLLAAMLVAVLAITGIVMARESDNAAQRPSGNTDALAIALTYLDQNKAELGLTAADLAEARVTDTTVSRLTGVTTIYLLQQLGGIEVFNGLINISIMPNGDVLTVGNRFVSDLAGSVSERNASVSAEQAVQAAAAHLDLSIQGSLQIIEQASSASQETLFSDGGISQNPIPAKLVYDTSGKTPRLAWNVIIYQLDSQHWWNVRVDANTREVLSQNDWVVNENFDAHAGGHSGVAAAPLAHTANSASEQSQQVPYGPTPVADGSSYRVYHLPIESPNHSSPPSPADGRTLVNTPADAGGGSPFGWHDTNGAAGAEFTTTQGNNVHAYTDLNNDNSPDPGSSPDGGAGLDFDFPLDLSQPPSAYRPAAVTNLFHWNNLMHDVNYRYGFDEVNGNFQENNYGNGGLGSDYVNAEAQDGGGTNNANFATPADGSNPRMQMYIWTAPTPDRDGDLDNGIIAHEYGHGISNRMVGGPSNVGCLGNSEQMGEGWSDWQSVIMTMRTGDTATTNRGVGTYALNQPINGVGIRPAPYNTDMSINNYTYANLPSMAVPHGVGFVWNTMLWEMNWGLIAEHGFNEDLYLPNTPPTTWSGNQLAHALVTQAFTLTPCNPGFVDGRNAILAADVALTGGQNACTIWAAFAKRGLGFSASQGSSSSISDGTPAFDMPQSCLTLGVTPTSQDICQGANAVYVVDIGTAFTPPVNMSATGNPAPSTATFSPNPVPTVPNTTDLTIGNTGSVPAGSYTINIVATDGTVTDNADVDLNVFAGAPGATTLVSPINGAIGVATSPTFEWTAVANATDYLLEVASDAGFSNIVYSANTASTTHTAGSNLNPDTLYFWRVTSNNPCGTGAVSTTFTFRTASILTVCRTPGLAIPDNNPAGVSDVMNIATSGAISDVDIYVNATHTWVGDVRFVITHNATDATIIDRPGVPTSTFGCSGNDYDVTVNDEGPDGNIETQCANAPAIFGDRVGGDPPSASLLAAYDGMDVSGDWTITVSDHAGGDTGTLVEWCVIASLPPSGGPAIDLEKTVSTDGSCGNVDALTVDYGTDVTYCYTVTNTGTVTLTSHTLVDDQLGDILTDFPYSLAPGASVFITETAVLTQTTTNTAIWTATDGVDSASDVDSATVTVVSTPVIDVAPESLTSVQGPDTTTTELLTISNVGTGILDWTIAEEPPAVVMTVRPAAPANPSHTDRSEDTAVAVPAGSAVRSVLPAAQPGLIQGDFSEGFEDITTLPGAGWAQINNSAPLGSTSWFQGNSAVFPAQAGSPTSYIGANFNNTSGVGTISNWLLTPEINLSDGSTLTFFTRTPTGSIWPDRLEVRMSTAGSSTDVGTTATSVGDFTNLLLEINPNLTQGGYPEDWTQFTVNLSGVGAPTTGRLAFRYFVTDGGPSGNNSNYIGIDTVAYTFAAPQGQCSAPSDVPWLSVSPAAGSTGGGQSSDVVVSFDSTGLTAGNTYTATLCVESNDSVTPLVTVPVTLTVVAPVYGVALSDDQAASGEAGTMVTYTLTVTNLGNVNDTIALTAASASGWTVELSDATVSLNAGASADVTVTVHIPANANDGDMDDVTVTAASQGEPAEMDTAVLTTTAVVETPPPSGNFIYLPIILKP